MFTLEYLCFEEILTTGGLRPEQKLAMAVVVNALRDVRAYKDMVGMERWEKKAYGSALRLMFYDRPALDFWCTIAGWDWRAVRKEARKIERQPLEEVPIAKPRKVRDRATYRGGRRFSANPSERALQQREWKRLREERVSG